MSRFGVAASAFLFGVLVTAAGFLTLGDDAQEESAAAAQDRRRALPEASVSVGELEPEPPAPSEPAPRADSTASAERAPATEPAPAERAPVSSAPEAGRTEAEQGDGKVEGLVRDEQGRPIAGAKVILRPTGRRSRTASLPEPMDDPTAAPEEPSEEEALARYAENWRASRAARRETTTGPDGRFVVSGLPEGTWQVNCWKRGFFFDDSGSVVETGREVVITGMRASRVTLDVRLPDGSAPAYAVVGSMDPSRPDSGRILERYGWTPEKPDIWLPPGTFKVRAEIPEEAAARAGVEGEWSSAPQIVRLAAGEAQGPVRLELRRRTGVRGRVVPPDNRAEKDYTVSLVPLAPGQEPPARLGFDTASTTTNAYAWYGFAFEFLDLTPGRYAVLVSSDFDGPILGREVVEVRDGIQRVEVPLESLSSIPSLKVSVLAPDGTPVPHVSFNWQIQRATSTSARTASATQDEQPGRFAVLLDQEVIEALEAGDGTVLLEAESEAWGEVRTTVTSTEGEILLRFQEPAELVVHVRGFDRPDVAGMLKVDVEPIEGDAHRRIMSGEGKPGPDGIVRKAALQPGRYRVVLYRVTDEYGMNRTALAEEVVDLGPGRRDITLTVPPLHTLTVVAPELDEGAKLVLQGANSRRRSTAKVRNGEAVFDALLEGEYVLMENSGMPKGVQVVRIPHAGPLTYAPQPVNALRVGPLDDSSGGESGFLEGDLVIAIDGQEFEGMMEMGSLLMKAAAKGEVTFTVLRGGRKVEVKRSMKDVEAGGAISMQPWRR